MTITDKYEPSEDRFERKFYKRANELSKKQLERYFKRNLEKYNRRTNDYIDNYVDRFGSEEFYNFMNEITYTLW